MVRRKLSMQKRKMEAADAKAQDTGRIDLRISDCCVMLRIDLALSYMLPTFSVPVESKCKSKNLIKMFKDGCWQGEIF